MEGNMPVDKELIRKALDHFENDEYTEAQDILKKEIARHRDEWLDDKLELGDKEPEGEPEASIDDKTDDAAADDDAGEEEE
jgi:hypothetical protein